MSNNIVAEENKSKMVIYQSENGDKKNDVHFYDETSWLTQAQLCELYHSSKANINEHDYSLEVPPIFSFTSHFMTVRFDYPEEAIQQDNTQDNTQDTPQDTPKDTPQDARQAHEWQSKIYYKYRKGRIK